MHRTLQNAFVLSVAWMSGAVGIAQSSAESVAENFDTDPKWESVNMTPPDNYGVPRRHDFGHSPTSHAGGAPGEIGGAVTRSLRPAYYAVPIAPLTLDDPITATGRFSVTHASGGSGVLLGFFNQASRGWRTPNSLLMRIDGEAGKFRVFFEYGTRGWKTGGGQTFDGDCQTTTDPLFISDGTPHGWTLRYDPNGAEGDGEITFLLDDESYPAALAPGHKNDGAVFDRFGIMNVQLGGDSITLFIDDVTINGRAYDFAHDPFWEGVNNRESYVERIERPFHEFGYRTTNHAGGRPGEIGGIVWRNEATTPEYSGYYALPVEILSLRNILTAKGKLSLTAAAADSGVLIGWLNSHTYIGAPPMNFLGVFIEGPSRVGHHVRPAYANAYNQRDVVNQGPVLHPDGKPRD